MHAHSGGSLFISRNSYLHDIRRSHGLALEQSLVVCNKCGLNSLVKSGCHATRMQSQFSTSESHVTDSQPVMYDVGISLRGGSKEVIKSSRNIP